MEKIMGAKVRTLCKLKNKAGIVIEKGEICTVVQSYRGYGIRTDDYRQINRIDKADIEFIKPLKFKKVAITLEEYQAIQLGLSEIEGSISYGDLPEKEIAKYKESEEILRNLLAKIKNV